MRILVAHPSPVVADGMAATLAEELGAEVDTAHTERQLRQLVATGGADVTVLDANFAGGAVCRLCHELSESGGRVVVVTRPGRESHLELLASGAVGIVAATNGLAGLVLAVRTVTQGHTHVPAHLLGAVLHEVVVARRQEEQPAGDRLESLSPREREVLALLGRGADTREIAARLVISPYTAKTHINRLLGKLGLASRTEAAAFAVSHDVRPSSWRSPMTDVLPVRPRRTSSQPVERWAEGAVVVPGTPDAPVALALNPTALALWELCDGQTAVTEMVDAVCVLFEVDPARAREDVETALREMVSVGDPVTTLVERPAPPASSPPTTWAWASGPCRALEHTFEVVVEAGWLVEPLAPVIAPFRVRAGVGAPVTPRVRYEIRSADREGFVSAYAGDERLATGRSTQAVLGGITWHINRSVIEHSVDRYVLMHAASATLAGITVVLAADMESGKTTTVAGLLRSGFAYVTDEAVALDPETCRVSPFGKTLSLDPGSWTLFPECAPLDDFRPRVQWFVEPHHLGARTNTLPVAAPEIVLFPKYVAGATTEVLPVSPAEATHELARMTFDFARHPRRNLEVAARLARTATCARLRIGDLEDAVEVVHELVSQRILDTL